MAKHNTDVKENHSELLITPVLLINGLLPTLHRPEHGVVVAVADSGGVCETRSPQAGPVPCHLDDGGAPHSSYWGDLPALHGHGAGGEDPAQNRHEEGPNLDHANLHLEGRTWILDNTLMDWDDVKIWHRLMQKASTSWSEILLSPIQTGEEEVAARLHWEGVVGVF